MDDEREQSHIKFCQVQEELQKLHEDVLAKTQQVKQYKKQVDGLKAEVTKYKSQKPAAKEEVSYVCELCLCMSTV